MGKHWKSRMASLGYRSKRQIHVCHVHSNSKCCKNKGSEYKLSCTPLSVEVPALGPFIHLDKHFV